MVIEMKQSTNTNNGVGNEEKKTGGWICHKSSQTMATRNDTPFPKDKRECRNLSPLALEANMTFSSHDIFLLIMTRHRDRDLSQHLSNN